MSSSASDPNSQVKLRSPPTILNFKVVDCTLSIKGFSIFSMSRRNNEAKRIEKATQVVFILTCKKGIGRIKVDLMNYRLCDHKTLKHSGRKQQDDRNVCLLKTSIKVIIRSNRNIFMSSTIWH